MYTIHCVYDCSVLIWTVDISKYSSGNIKYTISVITSCSLVVSASPIDLVPPFLFFVPLSTSAQQGPNQDLPQHPMIPHSYTSPVVVVNRLVHPPFAQGFSVDKSLFYNSVNHTSNGSWFVLLTVCFCAMNGMLKASPHPTTQIAPTAKCLILSW